MARLADVPFEVRMKAAARLCGKTDDMDERRQLFLTALFGRDPTIEDYDHLMECVDPYCGQCAA